MKRIIKENLVSGDLTDMVVPVIEIDTFEPKIDDDNIVVAFFFKDENAAYDLSHFIEFGPIDILDTEVSPATDENGNWVVFVEMERKNRAKTILNILRTVKYLTDISEWKYSAYDKTGNISV